MQRAYLPEDTDPYSEGALSYQKSSLNPSSLAVSLIRETSQLSSPELNFSDTYYPSQTPESRNAPGSI